MFQDSDGNWRTSVVFKDEQTVEKLKRAVERDEEMTYSRFFRESVREKLERSAIEATEVDDD